MASQNRALPRPGRDKKIIIKIKTRAISLVVAALSCLCCLVPLYRHPYERPHGLQENTFSDNHV